MTSMTLDERAWKSATAVMLSRVNAPEQEIYSATRDAIRAYLSALPTDPSDLRAENERLREALLLTSGALQAGQTSMAPRVAFTREWSHLGTRLVSEILDTANAALTRTGGNHA